MKKDTENPLWMEESLDFMHASDITNADGAVVVWKRYADQATTGADEFFSKVYSRSAKTWIFPYDVKEVHPKSRKVM